MNHSLGSSKPIQHKENKTEADGNQDQGLGQAIYGTRVKLITCLWSSKTFLSWWLDHTLSRTGLKFNQGNI